MSDHDTGATAPEPELGEQREWRALGFVDAERDGPARNWAPLVFAGAEDDRRYGMACRVGRLHALEVIRHLRRFPGHSDRFVELIAEIVRSGRWTAIEIGMVAAIAEYIAEERVWLTPGFEVVDLRRAA